METALYRLYDSNDNLLYVGISNNWLNRFDQHSKSKSWINQLHRADYEWYGRRTDAALNERLAIRWENPIHNRQSVVKYSVEWRHLLAILSRRLDDDFHSCVADTIASKIAGIEVSASVGMATEWATCNALNEQLIENIDTLPCNLCTKLYDSYWLPEGHDLMCDLATGNSSRFGNLDLDA